MKGYKIIKDEDFHQLSREAVKNERKRLNYNLHAPEDRVQRFFNALEPDTYLRPHRHLNPPKSETFIIMKGTVIIIIFDDRGTITDACTLSRSSGNHVIDIDPGIWHSLVCETEGTVCFEIKEGPYIPLTDKNFAPWSPEEGSKEAAEYREKMRSAAKQMI